MTSLEKNMKIEGLSDETVSDFLNNVDYKKEETCIKVVNIAFMRVRETSPPC